jgi:hypothetical protein
MVVGIGVSALQAFEVVAASVHDMESMLYFVA